MLMAADSSLYIPRGIKITFQDGCVSSGWTHEFPRGPEHVRIHVIHVCVRLSGRDFRCAHLAPHVLYWGVHAPCFREFSFVHACTYIHALIHQLSSFRYHIIRFLQLLFVYVFIYQLLYLFLISQSYDLNILL